MGKGCSLRHTCPLNEHFKRHPQNLFNRHIRDSDVLGTETKRADVTSQLQEQGAGFECPEGKVCFFPSETKTEKPNTGAF